MSYEPVAYVADAFNSESVVAVEHQLDGDLNIITVKPQENFFGHSVRIRSSGGGSCYGDFYLAMYHAFDEHFDRKAEKSLFHLMGHKPPTKGTVIRMYNDDIVIGTNDPAIGQLNVIVSSRPIRRIGLQTFSQTDDLEEIGPIVWLDRTNIGTEAFDSLWKEVKRLKNGELGTINKRYFVNDPDGIRMVKKMQKDFKVC